MVAAGTGGMGGMGGTGIDQLEGGTARGHCITWWRFSMGIQVELWHGMHGGK